MCSCLGWQPMLIILISQVGFKTLKAISLKCHKYTWLGVTGLAGWCKYDVERRTPYVGITGYDTLPPNDLEAAMNHIANVGPLAIASDASRWQLYGHGVFSGCGYENNININHAIQLVGYKKITFCQDHFLIEST